jgi:hypothetical protein
VSSTNRGRERQKDDVYETPPEAVHAFLSAVDLPKGTWFEPCAGSGAIIRAARPLYPEVTWFANELREECDVALSEEIGRDNVSIGDYLEGNYSKVDLIITNPPFSLAIEFIEKSMTLAPISFFLLRLNFLESKKRSSFFKEHCPDVYVLSKRPSLVLGRTDSTGYCWAGFHQIPRKVGTLMVLSPPEEGLYAHKNRGCQPRGDKDLLR